MSAVPPIPESSPENPPASDAVVEQTVYKNILGAIARGFEETSSHIPGRGINAIIEGESFDTITRDAFQNMFLSAAGLKDRKQSPLLKQPVDSSQYNRTIDAHVGIVSGTSAFLRNLIGYFYPASSSLAIYFAGEATPMNLLAGKGVIAEAAQSLKEASRGIISSDEAQKTQARIKYWRGYMQLGTGFSMFVQRPAAGYCAFEKLNAGASATTTAGKVAFYSSLIGNGFMTLCFLFLAAEQVRVINRLINISRGVGAGIFSLYNVSNEKALGFLVDKLNKSECATLEQLKQKYGTDNKKIHEELEKEADHFAEYFVETVYQNVVGKIASNTKTGSNTLLQTLELGEEEKKIITELFKDDSIKNGISDKALLGFYIADTKKKEQARQDLERILGKDLVQKIESYDLEYVQKNVYGVEESKEIMKEVHAAIANGVLLHVSLLLTGVVGSVIMGCATAAYYCIAAPFVLANTVMTGFVTAFLTILSVKELCDESKKEGYVSSAELVSAYGGVLVSVACLVGIIVFSAGTMGTGPVILSMIIVVIWIGASGVYARHIHQRREEYLETSASMDTLIGRVEILGAKAKIAIKDPRSKLEKEAKKIGALVKRKLEESHLSKKDKEFYHNFFTKHFLNLITNLEIEDCIALLQDWKKQEEAVREAMRQYCEDGLSLTEEKTFFERLSAMMPVNAIIQKIWHRLPAEEAPA